MPHRGQLTLGDSDSDDEDEGDAMADEEDDTKAGGVDELPEGEIRDYARKQEKSVSNCLPRWRLNRCCHPLATPPHRPLRR